VREAYLRGKTGSDLARAMGQATDEITLRQALVIGNIVSPRSPVFLYEYAHLGESSFLDPLLRPGETMNREMVGVDHCDDVTLMFSTQVYPRTKKGSADDLVGGEIWRRWFCFAATGRPGENWPSLAEVADSAFPRLRWAKITSLGVNMTQRETNDFVLKFVEDVLFKGKSGLKRASL